MNEPISQMPESLGEEAHPRLSPAWLQAQMVNALEEKVVYRGTAEVVCVLEAHEGDNRSVGAWLVISDGRHSARCGLAREVRLALPRDLTDARGRCLTLRTVRASKIRGQLGYYARCASLGGPAGDDERPPDIDADGSLTARERATRTDVAALVEAEDESAAATDLDLAALLELRQRLAGATDVAELSLEDDEAEPPISPGLDVDMRATAEALRRQRHTIQQDTALLVRLWANDIAAAQLGGRDTTFRLSVEQLPCTGWLRRSPR